MGNENMFSDETELEYALRQVTSGRFGPIPHACVAYPYETPLTTIMRDRCTATNKETVLPVQN